MASLLHAPSGTPVFTVRPFVVGAIGRVDPEIVARVVAAAGNPDLVLVRSAPGVMLYATGGLAPYRSDADGVAFTFGERRPRRDGPWHEVAEAVEAPGLVDAPAGVTLHASPLGLIDLFHRQTSGGLVFASRIAPLLAMDETRLSVDWEAWAAILILRHPLGTQTTFREVRRLEGGTTITWRRDGGLAVERRRPSWAAAGARAEVADPPEVLAAIRAAVADSAAFHDSEGYAVMLSGGFDSRLLAIIARDQGLRIETWSSLTDDGREADVAIARDVAAALGLPFEAVEGTPSEYVAGALGVMRRLEHQVDYHAWMEPMVSVLRRNGLPVFDGLGGGHLLRDHWAGAARPAQGVPVAPRMRLFAALARARVRPPLSMAAAAWCMERASSAWEAASRHLEGHPRERELGVMEVRLRASAVAPVWLLSPDVPALLPYLDARVLAAGLRADRATTPLGLQRALLDLASPGMGTHPSTHDAPSREMRRAARIDAPEVRRWLLTTALAAGDAVPGLVRRRVRSELAVELEALVARPVEGRSEGIRGSALLSLAMLGDWLTQHEHRLASVQPPWATREAGRAASARRWTRALRRRAV